MLKRDIDLQIENTDDSQARLNFFRIREFLLETIVPNVGIAFWNPVQTSVGYTSKFLDEVYADTRTVAFTVSAPANPELGDRFRIIDSNGNFATKNLTIHGNNKNVDGAATKLLSTNNSHKEVVYNGSQWITLAL